MTGRRGPGALGLLLGVTTLCTGCALDVTADAADMARAELADGVVRAHERALDLRAADPAAADDAAAELLGEVITGGTGAGVVSATVTSDGVEAITLLATRAHADGVVPVVDDAPVEAVTTDLPGVRTPVPRPDAPPCFSGPGDCVGG